jgi:hypothetical protein
VNGQAGRLERPALLGYRVERGTLTVYLEHYGALERRSAGPGDVVHIPASGRTRSATSPARRRRRTWCSHRARRWSRASAALAPGDDVLALAARHGMEMTRPL